MNLSKFNYMARGVSFKMRIRVKYEEAKSDNIIWYRWIKRAIDFSGEAANAQEGGRKVPFTNSHIPVISRFGPWISSFSNEQIVKRHRFISFQSPFK